MPGAEAKPTVDSYVAVGKETTFGTYNTVSAAVEALSCSFKTELMSKKIESLHGSRGYAKRVTTDKVVAGALEHALHPEESVLIVANALGGGIGTSSLTASCYTHSITAGDFDTTPVSLCFNVRKGDEHVFEYNGGRVNVLKIAGTLGEEVKITSEMIFKDSTVGTNDVLSNLSISTVLPFTYVQGTFRYAATSTALTSTVAEAIQAFELTVNNNLKPEAGRELGSAVLTRLPATRRSIELKITQRFDTTTTLNRHLQATVGAVELFLEGESASAEANYTMQIQLPKVYQGMAEPEVPGGDDVLKSEITYDVVAENPGTTTVRDIGVTVINKTASY